jgi:5-formyltetrahydrofolate cyclo-ligase
MTAAKPELRRQLRARREAFVAALDGPALEKSTDALLGRLEDELRDAGCVAAYLPLGSEVDVSPILARAAAFGKRTALPHVAGRDAPMRFLAWRPGELLEIGLFGLRQPIADAPEVEPDLIVAPLLGFDRALRRIGQGAGFYDRAFATVPAARRIGVAWSVQEVAAIPTDPWDMPLHAVVTERERIEGEGLT